MCCTYIACSESINYLIHISYRIVTVEQSYISTTRAIQQFTFCAI